MTHTVSHRKSLNRWPLNVSRLLIIGCGGYIGSHLLDTLLDENIVEIRGWDPCSEKIRHHLDHPNFDYCDRTLNDKDDLEELERSIQWADVVINLAAVCQPAEYNTNPITVIRTNFLEPYKLVELCATHRKWLIHFSTSEVYGRTISSYIPNHDYADPQLYELDEDETPLIMGPIKNQRWTYACAKQLIERYIYAHSKETAMQFTIIRPLNFFGPRMDYIPGRDGEGVPRVLACFMTALLNREPMQLVDNGTARRTIVSIRDAIDAIVLILKNPERSQNQIFNIGNRSNELTMAELAELMRDIYSEMTGDASYRSHPIVSVSRDAFYGEGYEDCDRRMPNLDKMYHLLNWRPAVSLRQTLYEAMAYYHEQYATSPVRDLATGVHVRQPVGELG